MKWWRKNEEIVMKWKQFEPFHIYERNCGNLLEIHVMSPSISDRRSRDKKVSLEVNFNMLSWNLSNFQQETNSTN